METTLLRLQSKHYLLPLVFLKNYMLIAGGECLHLPHQFFLGNKHLSVNGYKAIVAKDVKIFHIFTLLANNKYSQFLVSVSN